MYDQLAIELNEQNLQQVIEQSMQTPVVISFWAPSMPETAEVNQILEKLAASYQGQVTLATLNCEASQWSQASLAFAVCQPLPYSKMASLLMAQPVRRPSKA